MLVGVRGWACGAVAVEAKVSARVCIECDAALSGAQQKFCSPRCAKRHWLRDPEHRARDRQGSRFWKGHHAEQVREYEREYAGREEVRGFCERCGGLLGRRARGRYRVCQACHTADVERRREHIVRRYLDGVSVAGIAEELGSTLRAVADDVHRLRAAGVDLPYRRRPTVAGNS